MIGRHEANNFSQVALFHLDDVITLKAFVMLTHSEMLYHNCAKQEPERFIVVQATVRAFSSAES